MKVLVADPISEAGVELLRSHGLEVRVGDRLDAEELRKEIVGATAVIVRSATTIDSKVIDAARDLRVIGRAGVGVDNIDVDHATNRGIVVVNAPQSNIVSAAEHTIALLMALARRIPEADRSVHAGLWERGSFTGTELNGKTLGVLGLGRVGQLVAKRAAGLGMSVVAHDPYIANTAAERLGIELLDLDSLLAGSDVVTLHLPMTSETAGIIGSRELGLMKVGAYLVNTARGGLVDERALATAIESERIAGAGLDVFADEPPASDHPLLRLDRVITTPHLGASTGEAQERASVMICEAVLAVLEGQFPSDAINVPFGALAPEHRQHFLALARRLGRLAHALHRTAGDVIAIEVSGGIASDTQFVRAITASAAVGVLSEFVDGPISYVNVFAVAEERRIQVRTTAGADGSSLPDRIDVSFGGASVAGTIHADRDEERILQVWGHDIDLAPAEHMVFLEYEDRPGILGCIGQRFGDAGVNIGAMQVARRKPGGLAVMAMAVDGVVSREVLASTASEIDAHDVRSLSASRHAQAHG